MNWQEITELYNNGISFGSHTANHLLLIDQKKETIISEIRDSKLTIENNIQASIDSFS